MGFGAAIEAVHAGGHGVNGNNSAPGWTLPVAIAPVLSATARRAQVDLPSPLAGKQFRDYCDKRRKRYRTGDAGC